MRRFLWIAFLVVDALLLCFFAAGYLGRFVDPRTFWWPQLFAVALPVLSILLVLATPVFAVLKRWGMFALHLGFIALILVRFAALGGALQPPADAPPALRVASYNLGHFEIFSQAEQARKLGEVLGLLYPDILGLQEFLVHYRGQELRIRNLPYVANKLDSLGFQAVASNLHDVPSTFKPIWTRKDKLVQQAKNRIKINEEGYEAMSFMRMEFEWAGRSGVFYNVHMRTFGSRKPWLDENMSPMSPKFWLFYIRQYREAFQYRAWEAVRIKQMLDEEVMPVILGGDFNSTPHNWAFNHLKQGLQDVHAHRGSLFGTSYHVRFPLAKIDHILVSPHWKVYSATIPPLNYSDHRPVIAEIGWAEPATAAAELP